MKKDLISLLDHYNRPGGRYTYYPVHREWNNELTHAAVIDFLNSQKEQTAIDLYIHIPFCHSLCTFCGCNIKVMKSNCDNQVYLNRLQKEWKSYPDHFLVENLYLGGGTPNFLIPSELSQLLSFFNFKNNPTIKLELDPRFLRFSDLDEYKKMGITHLSFGIQDFDAQVLKNVNREQDCEKIIELINYAHQLHFEEINLDFIYGLSFQSVESIVQTFNLLKKTNVTSVTLFPFAKVPWQNNSQMAFGEIKDFSMHELNQFFVTAKTILIEIGFDFIGMGFFTKNSNHQKNQFLRRNIMGFTTNKNEILLGLGVSAISSLPIGHTQNEKIYDKYLLKIKEGNSAQLKSHLKTPREHEREQFYEKVVCENIINLEDVIKFKTPLFDRYLPALLADELLTKTENGFVIKPEFRFFHKTILQLFDPHFIDQ